jgi:inward rectifier potassium channel
MILRRSPERARSVKIGDREFLTKGINSSFFNDAFHNSMVASWPVFFLGFAVYFLAINMFFASLFWLGGNCIVNARPGSFADKFFFSIETLATVGYGDMHPGNIYAHTVVAGEIFVGLSTLAVFTGLIFARFSRPRARVIFADALTLARHEGQTMLMARLANARQSSVNEARAEIWMTYSADTAEGLNFRRFTPLALIQPRNPIFAFSWTLFHVIDAKSPLFGLGPADLDAMDAFFVVIFDGIDDVSGQKLNVRKAYPRANLRFGHIFSDILSVADNGLPQLDYGLIHETEPQEEEEGEASD